MTVGAKEEKKPFHVNCGDCGHTWALFYFPMEMGKTAKVSKKAICPMCAASGKRIFVGPAPEQKQFVATGNGHAMTNIVKW